MTGRIICGALLGSSIACGSSTEPEPLQFVPPIVGTPNVDVYYGAYRDLSSSLGALDYTCGGKTFDSHTGTDILIRDFAAMDSGVTVVAAAAGRVVAAVDGEFDRNAGFAPASAGNHVILDHGDTFQTLYAHMKRESILVAMGDDVNPGEPLGEVGSSGSSNWPHLHFDVFARGAEIDPFNGPCNPLSMWETQLPYQNDFMVIGGGIFFDAPFSLGVLLEAPESPDTVIGGTDGLVYWVATFNQTGDHLRFQLVDPNGTVVDEFRGVERESFALRYLGVTFAVPADPAGQWQVRMLVLDREEHVQSFVVVEGGGPPASGDRGTVTSIEVGPFDGFSRAGPTVRVVTPWPSGTR